MSSTRVVLFALVSCGCKYEFVEGPDEAGHEDSSESAGAGTDGDEQDQPEAGDTTDDTGGSKDVCGNGVVDPPEECDEDDFSGRDCMTLGFKDGTLACTEDCELDTTTCRD